MLRLILVLLIFAVPSSALADDYSTQYGDGLRFYAEGRYDVALESLYRAYALKPSPSLLRLIIRSHDFMGHCSAVQRQLSLFAELHPKEKAVTPQLCENPGTLRIECSPHAGTVMIDHMITASCGTEIRVPAGTHQVHNTSLNEVREFVVETGKTTVATLQLNPEKWFPSRSNEAVPLLKDPRHFTVIKSPDGLYEIWVRSDLRNDPDMNGVQVPGFTILKSTDGLYDISSDALKAPYTPPEKPRERRKMPVVPITP